MTAHLGRERADHYTSQTPGGIYKKINEDYTYLYRWNGIQTILKLSYNKDKRRELTRKSIRKYTTEQKKQKGRCTGNGES